MKLGWNTGPTGLFVRNFVDGDFISSNEKAAAAVLFGF